MNKARAQEELGLANIKGRFWAPGVHGMVAAAENYELAAQPADAARCLSVAHSTIEAWLLSLGASPLPARKTTTPPSRPDHG